MNDYSTNVKEKLNSIISDMASHPWLFSNNPGRDFMRQDLGKLSFYDTMRLIIGMGKGSTNEEIMENPSILILDEPFNGLDKNGVAQIRDLIRQLREEGKTILLASHNQADIDELCDTVCEIDAGTMTMWRK